MPSMTITEALAEIKTINARLDKKRAFVIQYLWRQEKLRDPFQKDGGAPLVLASERQAIRDLENRIIALRRAIQHANDTNTITDATGATATIAELLTWRREIADGQKVFLGSMRSQIEKVRRDAQQRGLQATSAANAELKPDDVIIHVDEKKLAEEIEKLEETLGSLDGQLSLKNATIMVTVP